MVGKTSGMGWKIYCALLAYLAVVLILFAIWVPLGIAVSVAAVWFILRGNKR